jgi:hypothetical protein
MNAKGQTLKAEILILQPSAFILHPSVARLPAILDRASGGEFQ